MAVLIGNCIVVGNVEVFRFAVFVKTEVVVDEKTGTAEYKECDKEREQERNSDTSGFSFS